MDNRIYVEIEEYINKRFPAQKPEEHHLYRNGVTGLGKTCCSVDMFQTFEKCLENRIKINENKENLYDLLLKYIKRLRKDFYKKNGVLNADSFCKYAIIDKSTWSNIQHNVGKPSKETLLKLIIVLELNETEATEMMNIAGNCFCYSDFRDQLILAIIDVKLYDVEAVYEIMEKYRNDGVHNFKNIY